MWCYIKEACTFLDKKIGAVANESIHGLTCWASQDPTSLFEKRTQATGEYRLPVYSGMTPRRTHSE